MGLLEETIREHLELQRRRGGDPHRIAVAEQEALQPLVPGQTPAWAEGPMLFDHEQSASRAPAIEDAPAAAQPGASPDPSLLEQETAELDMSTVFGDRLAQPYPSDPPPGVPDGAPVRARRIVPEELTQMRAEADFEWEVPERTAPPEDEPSPARHGSFDFE
jgi:hypothetical protein